MKKSIWLLVFIFFFCNLQAQVTKVGNDTLIDIACWNVEWFGDVQNGPGNEALQYTNVKNVLQNTDIDVWGLAEVCNATTFNTLLNELSVYDGLMSSYSLTQKTALLWKKDLFNLISFKNISDPSESNFTYAFASRPPLEVVLTRKDTAFQDTVYFYVVHLKANSGGNNQSNYDRRKDASVYLKKYLDNNRKGKKVVVLGDWNDDVDLSVVRINNVYLETPFSNFINDSANYFFTSRILSFEGKTTYPNFNPQNMIDHVLNTTSLADSFYVKSSSKVISQLSSQISGYLSNTSDHYPVMSSYNFKRYLKPEVKDTSPTTGFLNRSQQFLFSCYPNPVKDIFYVESEVTVNTMSIYSVTGQLILKESPDEKTFRVKLPDSLSPGIYLLNIETDRGTDFRKILVE